MAAQAGQTVEMRAGSGLGQGDEWRAVLDAALSGALAPLQGHGPDLLLLFASDRFGQAFPELLRHATDVSSARMVVGCSASGVIGGEQELEGQPAISALALELPRDSLLGSCLVTADRLQALGAGGWPGLLGIKPEACTGLVVLADPFTMDVEALLASLAQQYPGVAIVGGLASGTPHAHGTHVFHDLEASGEGAVVIGLSGSVRLKAVVSQGTQPIGEPWTITAAHGHVLQTIGNRPAYEVLADTLKALPNEAERHRAAQNLLVGLAMDEYRESFGRGDFLIRNLMGVDQASGAIAIGANPRVGQTMQFQVRDAAAADEELDHLLKAASDEIGGAPAAALLFACNGRGENLFGQPHHDARAARAGLGAPPLAGFFCNGEIGPVGKGTFLHGFTASLGLLVAAEPALFSLVPPILTVEPRPPGRKSGKPA